MLFDGYVTSNTDGDTVTFELTASGKHYKFALKQEIATLMVAAIQAASTRLPEWKQPTLLGPTRIRPIVTADFLLCLQFDLGANLAINIAMPPQGLADLNTAIADLQKTVAPEPTAH